MRRQRRSVVLLLSSALLGVVAAAPASAQAAPGPYSGSSSSSAVHIDALTLPGVLTLADVDLGRAVASVNNRGLTALNDVFGQAISVSDAQSRSRARSAVAEAELATDGAGNPLLDLNEEFDAEARAPADSTDTYELTDVPLDPIANVSLADGLAVANYSSDQTCVTDRPLSSSTARLTDVGILTDTLVPNSPASVGLPGESEGTSTTQLTPVGGQVFGLTTRAEQRLAPITLFEGSPNQITITVDGPAVLTATATGQPGGATVDYTAPIVQVEFGGDVTTLDAADSSVDLDLVPGVLSLARVQLGTLTNQVLSPNGTEARGVGDLLKVTLLDNSLTDPLATLSFGHQEVAAVAPVGGVVCPGGPQGPGDNPLREVRKDVSTRDVAAGGTFDYTITVPNRRPDCTLINVRVVDTVTGPPGSSIVGTSPPASSINGLTVVYDDIGPIQPNQVVVLTITVQVPANAPTGATYDNDVTVTGVCQEQPDIPFEGSDRIDDLPVVFNPSGRGPCLLDGSNKSESNAQVFPGETFAYFVHVLNSGTEACNALVVTDTLQGPITFVSCSNNCTVNGREVRWELGTLAGGSAITLTVVVQVDPNAQPGTRLPNAALLDATEDDANVSTPGPQITGESVLQPINPAALVDAPAGPAAPPAAPPAPQPPSGPTLPRTGATDMALVGLTLMLLGAAGLRLRGWGT